jgi:hypothetical protein
MTSVSGILLYLAASRLLVCDFSVPVLVREKLRLFFAGTALRLLRLVAPPLDIAFLWSTSTLSGRVP